MKARYIYILFMLVLAVSGMTSCVYPFEAELDGESGTFVIEGDILIGEVMEVNLSYTAPVDSSYAIRRPAHASVWVEDDAGGRYSGKVDVPREKYFVDMREADTGLKYRLRVENHDTGKGYASSWQAVCKAPHIDSLSYIVDEVHLQLDIALSMHSDIGSYFKWSYREDWEYHSAYRAKIRYLPDPITWAQGPGVINDIIYPDVPDYYCWDYEYSSEIMLFSTESQTEDRFVDLEFHSIPRQSKKISSLYHIEVQLEPITREAYLYWDNIRANSEYNGSLFAPNPSEMAGNIKCLTDTTEMVIGYINVAERDSQDMFYDNSEEFFYKAPYAFTDEPLEVASSKDWFSWYSRGYLPYDYKEMGSPSPTLWSLKGNVDCTCQGGTRLRPPYWPNDHR